MSCCGSKTRPMSNKIALDIPMVKAVFVTNNASPETLYGDTRVLGGRVIKYGRHRNGDVFNVAVADVRARPNRYLAPCGKPFTFDAKGGIIIPCEDEPVAPQIQHGDSLTDIPGIGPATAKKLVEADIHTKEQVAELSDSEMIDLGIPPQSRTKIREWTLSK